MLLLNSAPCPYPSFGLDRSFSSFHQLWIHSFSPALSDFSINNFCSRIFFLDYIWEREPAEFFLTFSLLFLFCFFFLGLLRLKSSWVVNLCLSANFTQEFEHSLNYSNYFLATSVSLFGISLYYLLFGKGAFNNLENSTQSFVLSYVSYLPTRL